MNITSSVCIRCGKQRIFLTVKEEIVGKGIVVTRETVCPDPDCQKKVDKMLREQREKRLQSVIISQEEAKHRMNLKLARQASANKSLGIEQK